MRTKNLEKRRRVMQRSMRLGHCICDPRQPCPCDILRQHDVCPCAGERLEAPDGPIRLTQLVEKPGCASKIDQAVLRDVLGGLPAASDPRVLVGMPAGDDAGVFRFDGNRAWVQTVDVFAPCVDDPYTFGQIAAANSVSDIYAMGGEPLTALSIVGFPAREVPDHVLRDILRGGIDKMVEAGVSVIGGHSINDREIKAGFAVTGLVDADRVMTNDKARPGDALVLTKPLGTGIISFAAQIGLASNESIEAAGRSMAALNRDAARLMIEFDAHACTDITGFGLMGHLANLARAGGLDLEVVWDDWPLLPGVLDNVAAGVFPGSIERNRESCGECVDAGGGVTREMLEIGFDAQTSGGLLVALPKDRAAGYLEALCDAGITEAAVIGHVRGKGSGRILVSTTSARRLPKVESAPPKPDNPSHRETIGMTAPNDKQDVACCTDAVETSGGDAAGVDAIQAKFKAFLQETNKPGALDVYTKQAIAIALSVLAKCEPCVKMHIAKARSKGFTQEEIDEAAWLAISFGGAPLMVWYEQVKKET